MALSPQPNDDTSKHLIICACAVAAEYRESYGETTSLDEKPAARQCNRPPDRHNIIVAIEVRPSINADANRFSL